MGLIAEKSDSAATTPKIARHFQSTMELFQSFTTELNTSTHTHTRIPANAFCTIGTSEKDVSSAAISVMMTSGGATAPSPPAIAPAVPRFFCPMNASVLTMMIPGRHWASA